MKKIIYSILLLAVTNSVFIACAKDEQIVKQIEQKNKIELTDYGFFHNEGLSLYYKSQNGFRETNPDIMIQKIATQLENKYPKEFSNIDISEIKNAFKNTDIQKFNIVSFWNSKKEELYLNNKLSPKIGGLVDKILKEEMSHEQYMLEIQKFRKENTLDVSEQNSLIIFESVLESSKQYWSSHNSHKLTARPGSQAIIADGMGALMFVYSGPLSIIAGCATSLFVNEAL